MARKITLKVNEWMRNFVLRASGFGFGSGIIIFWGLLCPYRVRSWVSKENYKDFDNIGNKLSNFNIRFVFKEFFFKISK